MRNDKGQFISGASGNPKGRPSRAEEQELLDIWDKNGREKFAEAVEQGQNWALKLLMDKLFPNRKATDITIGEENRAMVVRFDSAFIE